MPEQDNSPPPYFEAPEQHQPVTIESMGHYKLADSELRVTQIYQIRTVRSTEDYGLVGSTPLLKVVDTRDLTPNGTDYELCVHYGRERLIVAPLADASPKKVLYVNVKDAFVMVGNVLLDRLVRQALANSWPACSACSGSIPFAACKELALAGRYKVVLGAQNGVQLKCECGAPPSIEKPTMYELWRAMCGTYIKRSQSVERAATIQLTPTGSESR